MNSHRQSTIGTLKWYSISALLPLLVLLAALIPAQGQAQEGATNRAGIVVRYGNGQVQSACVHFSEDEITGYDLLSRSGLAFVAQQTGIGVAVCKIGGDGCDYPAEDCFCKRDGARAIYWAYHLLDADTWRYSNVGLVSIKVRDGVVHGWAWGSGDSSSGAQPPTLSIAAICGEVAALPPTPLPTVTPRPARPPVLLSTTTSPAPPAPTEAATLTVQSIATEQATRVPTDMPTRRSTSAPTRTTALPVVTPTAIVAQPAGTNGSSYLIFLALAIGLGVAIGFSSLRRGKSK